MSRMKGVAGAGGFEIGCARYIPDGNGCLVVAPHHVAFAKASGYVEIEEEAQPPSADIERPAQEIPEAPEAAQPGDDAAEPESAGK